MKESKVSKGKRGENLGKDILKKLGFNLVWDILDEDNRASSYDFLAIRWNQKYAINVKFGDKFSINYRNLQRLNVIHKVHGFKPAFLFIKSPKTYWFYCLDGTFPTKIDCKNQKMEIFG